VWTGAPGLPLKRDIPPPGAPTGGVVKSRGGEPTAHPGGKGTPPGRGNLGMNGKFWGAGPGGSGKNLRVKAKTPAAGKPGGKSGKKGASQKVWGECGAAQWWITGGPGSSP